MSSFEGSYLGASDKIGPRAIMECKICWTPYDPAEGDDTRQVSSGTSFHDLPEDWTCPGCSAPKEQFLVREDPDFSPYRRAFQKAERAGGGFPGYLSLENARSADGQSGHPYRDGRLYRL